MEMTTTHQYLPLYPVDRSSERLIVGTITCPSPVTDLACWHGQYFFVQRPAVSGGQPSVCRLASSGAGF